MEIKDLVKELKDDMDKKIDMSTRLTKLEIQTGNITRAFWGVIAVGGLYIGNQILRLIGG